MTGPARQHVRLGHTRLLGLAGAAVLVLALAPPALATTSTDAQANAPQVAGDASSDTTARFPTNKQNEPTIAVNPSASSHLIAGSNDEQEQPACGAAPRSPADPTDCSFYPGVGTDGVYTSSTGGASWTNRGMLDDYPGWRASRLVSDGDPVIVYGPRYDTGTHAFSTSALDAYYGSLASYKPGQQPGNQAPEMIVVSRSSDDGATWSGPSVAASASGHVFNDKNAVWADRNPGSPYFGRLYVSWTEFRSIPSTAEPVRFAWSGDGGRTWSNPVQLSGASNNKVSGGRQGSAIRTDGHGRVYVAWEEGATQAYAVSTDGGGSFSKARAIGPVADLVDPIPGSNFRNDSFLSLAADPRADSSTLYATWTNRTRPDGSAGELVVYRTTGSGWTKVATPYTGTVVGTGVPFFPGIDVSPDGRVDVGWQSLHATDPGTFGTGNASIDAWYAGAADGTSYGTPTMVSTDPSDPAASSQNNLERQFWGDYNTLVSGSSHAWFIYTDSRHGEGCPAVDAYQQDLVASGAVIQDEERGADAGKDAGEVAKPAPPTDCPAQFGNTDVFVSTVTP